jgi:hypothetical protein
MVDLLVLASSDQLLLILIFSISYKTSYLNEEVNCTEPSCPSRQLHNKFAKVNPSIDGSLILEVRLTKAKKH